MITINITEKECILKKPVSKWIDLYSYTYHNTKLISISFNDLLSVYCSVCEAAMTLDCDGGAGKAKSFKKAVVTLFHESEVKKNKAIPVTGLGGL
jgi:hypothetical protein